MPVLVYILYIDYSFAIKAATAILTVEIIGAALKFLYRKDRPVPMKRKTLYQIYDAGSFPSIHTARFAALLIVVAKLYLSWEFLLAGLPLVVAVGYSRVYLKKHYPVDVIGGFVIGAVIALICLLI